MKKQLFIITTTLFTSVAFSQSIQLWGTTAEGGNTNTGTVFQFSISDNTVTSKSLEYSSVFRTEYNGFIQAPNGKLYGVAKASYPISPENPTGTIAAGVIMEFDPSTNEYKELYQFPESQASLGYSPFGSLLYASNGKLYGTTNKGGANNLGVLFEFNPVTKVYDKLYDFSTASGGNPEGTLVEGSDGDLYGTTRLEGAFSQGTFFRFKLSNSSYNVIASFDGTQGIQPLNSLIKIDNSTILGCTRLGGQNFAGTIFKYDFMIDDFQIVYHMGVHTDLYGSHSKLAFDGVNKIYGTSSPTDTLMPSKLYCYNVSSDTVTILHTFNPQTDGHQPIGGVALLNGKLYGYCEKGGANNNGTFYSFDIVSGALTVIEHGSETATTFRNGRTSPLAASDGNIYLMGSCIIDQFGYTYFGSLTKYSPQNGLLTKLMPFGSTKTGGISLGSLVQKENGKLYGNTLKGGFFEVDRFNMSLTGYLVNDGEGMSGGLADYQGKFYGSGLNGKIYSFDYTSNQTDVETTVNFNATGGLIQAGSSIYGLIPAGGINGFGSMFRYNSVTNISNTEFTFDGAQTGSSPVGSLLLVDDSYFFGMTNTGGVNDLGVLYKYDPFVDDYTKLHDFNGSNGASPRGGMALHSNGKLYGMTYMGGDANLGVLFSYDYSTDVYTKLIDFDSINGSLPEGALFEASNGLIYGITSKGGVNNDGVIFSFNPTTEQLTKLFDFDREVTGSRPVASFIEVDMELSTEQLSNPVEYVIYPNPAHDQVTIKGATGANTRVTVTDLSGKTLLVQSLETNTIDISTLPKGMYVLTVSSEFGTQTQKLVKQ